MAALSAGDRLLCYSDFVREVGGDRETFNGVTKADLKAAVNALDDFLVANAAAINAAIPQPARASLTAAQKARMLMWVIRYRYVKGA